MNKIFLTLLSIFCLLATTFSAMAAPVFPHPVFGKITSDGYPVANLAAKIRNTNTATEGITYTDETGFYQVDLGNVDERYVDGQTIRVSLLYCENEARCVKYTTISGGGNEVSFDVTGYVIPDDTKVNKVQCWDGTLVTEVSLCPAVVIPPQPPEPPVIITKYVCEDGSEVETQDLCPLPPITPNQAIIAAISIVIIGLGIMWTWAKQSGLSGKYRWIPGMKGILESKLKRYKELCKLGEKKEAEEAKETLLKYSSTLTDKYLSQFQK